MKCPGCGRRDCYIPYRGPVECLNSSCKHFSRKFLEDEAESQGVDPDSLALICGAAGHVEGYISFDFETEQFCIYGDDGKWYDYEDVEVKDGKIIIKNDRRI